MFVPPLLFDVSDLALALRVSKSVARRLLKQRALPVVLVDDHEVRVRPEDVVRFVESRRQDAADGAPSPSDAEDDSTPVPTIQEAPTARHAVAGTRRRQMQFGSTGNPRVAECDSEDGKDGGAC